MKRQVIQGAVNLFKVILGIAFIAALWHVAWLSQEVTTHSLLLNQHSKATWAVIATVLVAVIALLVEAVECTIFQARHKPEVAVV